MFENTLVFNGMRDVLTECVLSCCVNVFDSPLPDIVVGTFVLASFSNEDKQILCAFRYAWPLLPYASSACQSNHANRECQTAGLNMSQIAI